MNAIALPSREILTPRLEFPRWLRFPRGVSDERVAKMLAPLAGALTPLGVSGIAANVLASVPWVAQWKFNNNGNDSIGSNNLTNNNSATFTTGKLGGATGATQLVAASSQYWTVTSSAVAAGNYDYYIAAWVYLGSTSGEMVIASDNYPNMIFRYNLNRFQFFWGPSFSVTANSFGAPSTGIWYFVEGFRDGTQNKIYICVNRGTTDSASNSDIPSGGGTFNIGMRSGALFWDGRIDNMVIARSSVGGGAILTTALRDALYNSGNGTETLT